MEKVQAIWLMTSHMRQGVQRFLNWLTVIDEAQVTVRNHFIILSLESLAQFWAIILTGQFAKCNDF